MESRPLVAAVILNWNHPDETLACVSSLEASDWEPLKILIVDNGSIGDDYGRFARLPRITLVRNEENLGFAGGMNSGIRRALEFGPDYILLLNNDTIVDSSMVRTLLAAAAERPDAGIISPIEFFRDAPDRVSSAGYRCDLRRAYQGPPLHIGERDIGQFRGVREVDVPPGTAMLVPVGAIREAGLLDEDLYLYIEDVDWALRMRACGRRTYVAAEARIWHGAATSSGGKRSPIVTYYHTRNTFVVSRRHAPVHGLRRVALDAEILVANLIHAVRGNDRKTNGRAVIAAWRDYLAGRLGACRHTFLTDAAR